MNENIFLLLPAPAIFNFDPLRNLFFFSFRSPATRRIGSAQETVNIYDALTREEI